MGSRYSKQELFKPVGVEGRRRLQDSRVAIVGVGALGSSALNLLAREGVGYIRIIDRDIVELDNLHRQSLYDERDVKAQLPKVLAAKNKVGFINSEVIIDTHFTDFNPSNAVSLISDVDVVVDGLDNFDTRFLLNEACYKISKPWIYGACLGSYGMVMSMRGGAPCFKCIIGDIPAAGSVETCDTAGVMGAIVNIIASIQVTEAMKIIVGSASSLKGLFVTDCWHGYSQYINVNKSQDCSVCVRGEFDFLNRNKSGIEIKLCGRNSVYLSPLGGDFNFIAVVDRVSKITKVTTNEYAACFTVDGEEFILFSDGRAIIKGTEDTRRAKSLYSKYIGT